MCIEHTHFNYYLFSIQKRFLGNCIFFVFSTRIAIVCDFQYLSNSAAQLAMDLFGGCAKGFRMCWDFSSTH